MEEKQSSIKIILDCLLCTIVAALLFFGSGYIPLFGSLVVFVWSFPVIVVFIRDGIASGIAVALTVAAICLMMEGVYAGLISAWSMAGLGLLYGVCFKKRVSPGMTVFFGMILGGFGALLAVSLGGLLGFVDIGGIVASFEDALEEAFAAYAEAGLFDEAAAAGMTLQAYENQVMTIMKQILPAMIIVSTMLVAAVNYLFATWLLKRRNKEILALPAFRNWHLPWWLMWGVIGGLLLLVVGNFADASLPQIIAKNILFSYCPVMLLAGISLVRYIMVLSHMGNGFQILIWIAAILFSSFFMIFFIFFGAVDTVIDYRTALEKRNEKKDGGTEK